MAVDADPTLKEAYRDRYFIWVRDQDDSLVTDRAPVFALPESFAGLTAGKATGEFVAGPVRWLLARLAHFPRLLLWPDREYRPPDGTGLVRPGILDHLSRIRARLGQVGSLAEAAGALVLEPHREDDAACFWEVAELVGWSSEDFYVSDEDTSEVYELHHHEKVVAIVPDQHARWLLLEELAALSDVFEDWSGYYSEPDEGKPADDEGGAQEV